MQSVAEIHDMPIATVLEFGTEVHQDVEIHLAECSLYLAEDCAREVHRIRRLALCDGNVSFFHFDGDEVRYEGIVDGWRAEEEEEWEEVEEEDEGDKGEEVEEGDEGDEGEEVEEGEEDEDEA